MQIYTTCYACLFFRPYESDSEHRLEIKFQSNPEAVAMVYPYHASVRLYQYIWKIMLVLTSKSFIRLANNIQLSSASNQPRAESTIATARWGLTGTGRGRALTARRMLLWL